MVGVIIVLFLFVNEKDILGPKSKGNNTTLLVLLFVGVVLFMCMNKKNIKEAFTVEGRKDDNTCNMGLEYCVKRLDDDIYKMQAEDQEGNCPANFTPICFNSTSNAQTRQCNCPDLYCTIKLLRNLSRKRPRNRPRSC